MRSLSLSWRLPQHQTATVDYDLTHTETFSALYESTHRRVYRYIFALGASDNAEDLTAETYFKAWNARWRFYGDEKAAFSWLLTIAKRLVIDQSRRRNAHPTLVYEHDFAHLIETKTPETLLQQNEQKALLTHLLETLSLEEREMVLLRYQEEWRYQEIAKHVGKTENTVTVQIKRAIEKMRNVERETSRRRLTK